MENIDGLRRPADELCDLCHGTGLITTERVQLFDEIKVAEKELCVCVLSIDGKEQGIYEASG